MDVTMAQTGLLQLVDPVLEAPQVATSMKVGPPTTTEIPEEISEGEMHLLVDQRMLGMKIEKGGAKGARISGGEGTIEDL